MSFIQISSKLIPTSPSDTCLDYDGISLDLNTKNESSTQDISTHIFGCTQGYNGHGLGCVQQSFDGHEKFTPRFSQEGLSFKSTPLSTSPSPLSNTPMSSYNFSSQQKSILYELLKAHLITFPLKNKNKNHKKNQYHPPLCKYHQIPGHATNACHDLV